MVNINDMCRINGWFVNRKHEVNKKIGVRYKMKIAQGLESKLNMSEENVEKV